MRSGDAMVAVYAEVLAAHQQNGAELFPRCTCGSDWSVEHQARKLLSAHRAGGRTAKDVLENREGRSHLGAGDTETGAARAVQIKSGTQRELVFHALRDAGSVGLTDDEIAKVTRLYLYSAAPRRTELLDMGLVEDSGLRRSSTRGHAAIVWRLTLEGHELAKQPA